MQAIFVTYRSLSVVFGDCQTPNVGRCPTPRTRRREARGAVLAGYALVLPPLVRLWPLLSRQGFAPSGPCPRFAAGRASQPGPLRALDPPSANTLPGALKRPQGAFSVKDVGIS